MAHILKSKGGSMDVRQIRTREALRASLLQAIADRPLDGVTIREITTAAHIAYATFFRHYPTKEALLEEAAEFEIRRLVDLVLPIHDEVSARAACIALCDVIDNQRDRWRALLTGSAEPVVRKELLRIALRVAEQRPVSWPPQEIRTALSVGAIIEILSWWLRAAEPPTAREISGLLYDRALLPGLK